MAPGVAPGFRATCAGLALLALGGLAFAYFWLERVLGLDPCPLCLFDRYVITTGGLVCLAGAVHNPRRAAVRRLYAGIATLAFAAGIVIGARHVWLQQLPEDEVPACGPDLDYMFDAFPFLEAVGMVFSGSGSCADVDTAFVGLTLAQWTLVLFVALTVLALYVFARAGRLR